MKIDAEGRHRPALCVLPRLLPFVLLLSACHPRTAPAPLPTPTVSPLAALSQRIEQALGNPSLAYGTWGIAVRSLERREPIYELNAGKLLMPASTLKIVTLATAADRLGWDYTYSTRLSYSGEIRDGILHGGLYVQGSGDPTFDDWDGKATAVFAAWAAQLKAAGIHTVTGGVIGNDNVFDDTGLGSGWMWDDLAASYSAPVSGLQFNQNSAQLLIDQPATSEWAPEVRLRPESAPLTVKNLLRSSIEAQNADIHASLTGTTIELTGSVPSEGHWLRNVAVPNPTLYFVNALKMALVTNGIEIQGRAEDLDDQPPRLESGVGPAPPSSSGTVAEQRSPPLSNIAETMMRLSQNLFAETLLKTMGVVGRPLSGVPPLSGTAAAGRAAEMETLTSWGIAADQILAVDGSGLSRYNLITPGALVSVLSHVYGDPRLRDPFIRSLPLAGGSGTLERRLAGTAAAGNVRAKTGSFTNARAVAGFVNTADGEPLAFAIIANNYGVPAPVVDAATDSILVALSEFRR